MLLIFKVLTTIHFFPQGLKQLNDIGLFTAMLLLKYLCVSRLCSHKIKDTEPLSSQNSFLQLSSKEAIGRAFYMQLHTRYLTQSCDPNVIMMNYKHYALVFSTQPIKANDKVRDMQALLF